MDYQTIVALLHELTVKNTKFEWKPVHKKAFEAIKQAVQKDCIMHYHNPKQRSVLTVDASPVRLRAILSNVDSQGNIHNVTYAGGSLSKVKQKYSQTEREALAVVWGCEKLYLYLVGTKFTIATDHKALEIIYNARMSDGL